MSRALFIITFLTLSILSTQKANAMERDANEIYEEALRNISVRNYANAFQCLEAVLQKDKSHPKALYTMGYLCEFATQEGSSTNALQNAVSWYSAAVSNVRKEDIVTSTDITIAANKAIARIVAKLHKRMSTVNVGPVSVSKVEKKVSENNEEKEPLLQQAKRFDELATQLKQKMIKEEKAAAAKQQQLIDSFMVTLPELRHWKREGTQQQSKASLTVDRPPTPAKQ